MVDGGFMNIDLWTWEYADSFAGPGIMYVSISMENALRVHSLQRIGPPFSGGMAPILNGSRTDKQFRVGGSNLYLRGYWITVDL